MAWNAATGWWVVAGGLVALELAIGTFYLLMLALGMVAAALCAHLGFGFAVQTVAAAVVGAAAVGALHAHRRRRPAAPALSANPDLVLDVGSRVRVEHWRADGTAHVQYRGSGWEARFVGDGVPTPGEHVIRAIDGTQLRLSR